MLTHRLITPLCLLVTLSGAAASASSSSGGFGGSGHEACERCRNEVPFPLLTLSSDQARVNYPVGSGVDHRHMKLEIWFDDLDTLKATAKQSLTVAPRVFPAPTIRLDAVLLRIQRVTVDGKIARYEHDGKTLVISCDPPLPAGKESVIVTEYEIDDPPQGLFFTPTNNAWPDRPAQVHSQGQPESNRYWFPSHDFPNERLTTELVVTVPEALTVIANGRLAEKSGSIRETRDGTGTTSMNRMNTWRWVQDKPHVSYLVSLIVGTFDEVELGSASLPIPVYVPQGRASDVKGTYGRTPQMIDFFGKLLDEPYPWDKYSQTLVWNFTAGGMENTSATTLYDTALFGKDDLDDFDLDGLISHELGHQWFGDLLTCNSWEHIWLNEGWATYLTPLWYRHRDGEVEYQTRVRQLFDGVIAADRGSLPETPAMASKVYRDPWETFRRAANPYGKGASVLRMLHARLGEPAFFAGVASYIDRHKLGTVESHDFRKALENASGQSLEEFFTQWVERPGVPRLAASLKWNAADKSIEMSFTQTQKLDALNPAFRFDLPVRVLCGSGWVSGVASITGRDSNLKLPMSSEPWAVVFDPDLTVVVDVSCDSPLVRSMEVAKAGPTINARVQALRAMLGKPRTNTRTLGLRQIVLAEDSPVIVRTTAIDVLRDGKDLGEIQSLLSGRLRRWEVREAVMNALGELSGPGADDDARFRSKELLVQFAGEDTSLRVRAAAIRALGKMSAGAETDRIVEASNTESQDDTLRLAALDALAALDRPASLAAAIDATKPGRLSRTRATALGIVAALAKHDVDRAMAACIARLDDRENRSRRAAGDALVTIGDPRAIPALERRALSAKDPAERTQAAIWIERLSSANPKK